MRSTDGRVQHLYKPERGEVVVTASRTGEYRYRRNDELIAVTLEAAKPTLLEAGAARQLVGDGIAITKEPRGEIPRRVRLLGAVSWQ